MSNLRTWAKWSVAAVLLLSPVLAFLMVIAVEASIDLVLEVGVPAMLDVMAVGAIVWVLFHNHRPRPDGAQSGFEPSVPRMTRCSTAPTSRARINSSASHVGPASHRAARRNRRPLRRGDWTTPIIGLARPSGCRPEAGAAAPIPDG